MNRKGIQKWIIRVYKNDLSGCIKNKKVYWHKSPRMVLYHSWRKSSGSVGIGRRARLRILWSMRSCGFKSHLPQILKEMQSCISFFFSIFYFLFSIFIYLSWSWLVLYFQFWIPLTCEINIYPKSHHWGKTFVMWNQLLSLKPSL